jgi:uncharacterized protein
VTCSTPDRASKGILRPRAWLITDDKAGMIVQCRGVADALNLDYVHKQINPKGLRRLLSPWLQPAKSEHFGKDGSAFAPPWPDIALATGRLSIPYIRALSRSAGVHTFTVVLQDPRTGLGTADMIWVPEHDLLRGPNVITTITAPHSFSQDRLSELRKTLPNDIAALPRPRVAILLGGPTRSCRYTQADLDRFGRALASILALNPSFLITSSRRTTIELVTVTDAATRSRPRLLWTGRGENPYASFLAHADVLIVTADSVNMTSEACATGRPVYVFEAAKFSHKLARFHLALRRYGATRSLPDGLSHLEPWTYAPLDAASQIAAQIARRWMRPGSGLSPSCS